jgi:predicted secreted protein
MIQTIDGGYALAGYTSSYGPGIPNFWFAKTDSAGNMQWSRTYGGTGSDIARDLTQTSDGGYALAGSTTSFGAGGVDFWLVKTDATGNTQWSKTYGGTGSDYAWSMVQTIDGGYALAGDTNSFGAGGSDFWLVKANATGTMQWSRTYGGTGIDVARDVIQTIDGGYALAGYTWSLGAGMADFWLVKTDASGIVEWNKTYGETADDAAYSMVQTIDGGYALAGDTYSFGAGGVDFWLVKTDASGIMEWNKTHGGTRDDYTLSMVRTDDGGYAQAGYTYSYGAGAKPDFWLVKTDSAGNMQWTKTHGGTDDDRAYSVVQTTDGGYALAGPINSFGAGSSDFWLVKTDIESGLARTHLTNNTITLYRGKTDLYWNYVRVRIWVIKEPSWIYGDINMDGVVDSKDLYIIGRNYGKTFSLLSLGGIICIAGIRTVKKRKQGKQPSYVS